MSSLVCIKTVATRPEAELARGLLEASGIRVVVPFDDAGGLRPEIAFTRGVRLLVDVEQAHRARELLAAQERPETTFERRVLTTRLRGCMIPATVGFLLLGIGAAVGETVTWLGVIVVLAGATLLVLAVVRGRRAA